LTVCYINPRLTLTPTSVNRNISDLWEVRTLRVEISNFSYQRSNYGHYSMCAALGHGSER